MDFLCDHLGWKRGSMLLRQRCQILLWEYFTAWFQKYMERGSSAKIPGETLEIKKNDWNLQQLS